MFHVFEGDHGEPDVLVVLLVERLPNESLDTLTGSTLLAGIADPKNTTKNSEKGRYNYILDIYNRNVPVINGSRQTRIDVGVESCNSRCVIPWK